MFYFEEFQTKMVDWSFQQKFFMLKLVPMLKTNKSMT